MNGLRPVIGIDTQCEAQCLRKIVHTKVLDRIDRIHSEDATRARATSIKCCISMLPSPLLCHSSRTVIAHSQLAPSLLVL